MMIGDYRMASEGTEAERKPRDQSQDQPTPRRRGPNSDLDTENPE